MTIRLRRQLMAVYSFFLVWGGTLSGMALGIFRHDTPHWMIFGSLFLCQAAIFVAIRSRWSRRFRDPSLTLLQMVVAIVAITVLLRYAIEIRGAMLSVYFMIMTFGIFSLDRVRMIAMSAFVMACFMALTSYEWVYYREEQVFGISFGHVSVLLLGLIWFVYVGGYIYNLQLRIREQKASLADNHTTLQTTHEQLQDAMARLHEVAIRDELTGLHNRRYILERLQEELDRCQRSGSDLHLAIIDLDHFKRINDQYGHPVGDEVLCSFARLARESLRRTDLVARFGGEEFVIVFPDGRLEDTRTVLERLRQQFGAQQFAEHPDLHVSLSAGVVQSRPGDTTAAIIQRADEALYQAKADGRDRLVFQ
ncbi:MAG: diguanylate cyclase [Alcanivoracaceae bacterium]|nr:diguanylate cyclase [Alcanivoracaceae bacterium]